MNYSRTIQTPIGEVGITATESTVVRIGFGPAGREDDTPLLRQAEQELAEYFAGVRRTFSLPLAPAGTPFQEAVWEALRAIPYGQTRSYKQIAVEIGRPKACRAVGMANNRNPLPIVVPCHRVLGHSGKLVGYAGGLDAKQTLLELEK